jgi:hypothetical protein
MFRWISVGSILAMRKRCVILVCLMRNVYLSLSKTLKKEVLCELRLRFERNNKTMSSWKIKSLFSFEDVFSNLFYFSRIFFAAVTFLTSRCPAAVRNTYTYTDWLERCMNYAVKMGSGAMVYIAISIKTCSVIHTFMGGGAILKQAVSTVTSQLLLLFI